MNISSSLARAGLALVLFHTIPTADAQTITDLPDTHVTLSGRLRIQGSSFGQGGTVAINGTQALTTVWRDDEVHAYVPESTALGTAQVQLTTSSGSSSNVDTLEVIPRQADGRVNWRFAVSSVRPNGQGPAVGPDGTLYVDDSDGRLYALAADGELLWIFDGNAGAPGGGLEGPIDVSADGTIYYATNPLGTEIRVHAVNPDGTARWMFSEFSVSYRIIAGPNIGPDGNLYLVFDRAHLGTMGACSLDPNGALRWSNTGSPEVNDTGSLGHHIAFSASAFYVAFNEGQVPGANDNYVFGFGYDGVQQFAVAGAWQRGRPHARADGSFVLRWGLDTTLRSLDAAGNEQWTFSAPANLTEPVVGPDGVTYHQVGGGPKLHAIGADGSIQWTVVGAQLGWMNFMGVSPQGGRLLDGGRAGLGQPGWVRSYSTANGDLEWSIDLPEEDPGSGLADLIVQSEWAFNADSSRGYAMVNALVFDSDDSYGYLYALTLGDPDLGSNYCTATANSTGNMALIRAQGSSAIADQNLTLVTDGVVPGVPGLYFFGPTQIQVAFGNGFRCVGGSTTRIQPPAFADGMGTTTHVLSFTAPYASHINAGTLNFQLWYRDNMTGAGFNLSDGFAIDFH